MSAPGKRPHMLPEEFEAVARIAAREAEGLRLEFIDGRLSVKARHDGSRGRVVQWLTRGFLESRPELFLHAWKGLRVQADLACRATADGVLAPSGAFAGEGEWGDPEPVLMVAEVTSYDCETDRRSRVDKPRVYAETGIPIYLLVDRNTCEVSVYSEPNGRRYECARTVPFGKDVPLPDPVGITLRTEPLKDWVR
ncbi:Uma2 family endonuclease [Streptomyces sp. NPDC059072]|uniref:Uma2 family endonuclease n=1 Tax=Streptomyces sp. NPDC059072 TaxID=3346715 RepID=UPI0036A15EC8